MRRRPPLRVLVLVAAWLTALSGTPVSAATHPKGVPAASTTAPPTTLGPVAAAPSGNTTQAIALRVATENALVKDLNARLAHAVDALALAEARSKESSKRLGVSAQSASALQAAARKQALVAYVQGDPASAPFAYAAALSQGDLNDVAWSLALLRLNQQRTLAIAKEAHDRGGSADADLTKALQDRDTAALEVQRLKLAIGSAQADLATAHQDLTVAVQQMGPTTLEGLTTTAFEAYRRAASALAAEQPACGLRWELLAAIGKTESNHASGHLQANGDTSPPILGPSIGADTDGGTLDGDPKADHAVGPMQFIPSTWRTWAADGNGDGIKDINNIWDETLAAGRYLCTAAGADTLRTQAGVVKAILSYNPNLDYLQVVGSRFEALASDVAAGWFSSGELPPPPPPDGSLPPAGDGRPPSPLPDTPPPPPGPTTVQPIVLATDTGFGIAVDPTPQPGACDAPTAVLAGRPGLRQCTVSRGTFTEQLDPCQVAPFDPTLAVCLPDPAEPGRLVRLAQPLPAEPMSGGPPFLLLVLDGGDRCVPIGLPASGPGRSRALALQTSTSDAASSSSSSTAGSSTSPPSTPAPTTATTDGPTTTGGTSTTPSSAPSTSAPSTTAPSTTDPSTTAAPTTEAPSSTSEPATTAASSTTSTTVPAAPSYVPGGYRCGSGATVAAQPDRSTSTWTVVVTQPGLAPRTVAVTLAVG